MDITRSIVSERDRALLSGDYASYHAQTTRKIHALRKRLGNATPKGKKYTPKTPVTVEQVASNSTWVQLLLVSAERAWAEAMAMKQAQSPENTQKALPGSTKSQIASRLRRAITYTDNLVDILEHANKSKASSTDLLEAKAYLAMLKGSRSFEMSHWQPCLENYAFARLVYNTLGESAKTDLYKDLLSSIVDPSIRYAAYQLKMPRTKPLPQIVLDNFPTGQDDSKKALTDIDPQAFQTQKEVAQTPDGIKDIPTHISWRTRQVKLEDAAISQALALAQQHEKTLDDQFSSFQSHTIDNFALASAYEDIITARQDAADATKNAIDELSTEGIDPGDPRMQSLQITRTAVNYAVIEYRIGRNRVLCGSEDGLKFEPSPRKLSTKPSKDGQQRNPKAESIGQRTSRLRERLALYESILQSLDSIKELPGVVADESLMTELSGKRSYFRALKCLAIGRSHAINGNTTNALALYNRALSLAQTAQSTLTSTSTATSSGGVPKLDVSTTSLNSSVSHLTKLVTQYRALSDLKSLSTTSTKNSSTKTPTPKHFQRPLIETLHLSQYHPNIDLHNIVNYPPKLQPIPVKPLFFDIAWNYIQYPGHEKKELLANGGAATNQARQGDEIKRTGTPSQDEKDKAGGTGKRGWFGFGGGRA